MRLSHLEAFATILCPTLAFAEATISLKAVAKNGVPITPTNVLNIAPNDLITAEIYLSGWNNPPFDGGSALISTYQVTLLGRDGARSSGASTCPGQCNSGYVLPRGWDAPLEKDSCPCDDPCYPLCGGGLLLPYGCVGPNFHPEQMASMNRTRQDYIFRGFDYVCGVDVSSPDIRWACTINGPDGQTTSRCAGGTHAGLSCSTNAECPGGTCDASFLSYLGTLNLKVGSSVCGTYTFTFSNDPNETFIGTPFPGIPILPVPTIQGLTLTTMVPCPSPWGACCSNDTGTCINNAPQEFCSGRWGGPCSTCVTMEPICLGPPIGACCHLGICTGMTTSAQCLSQWGGHWEGLNSTCAGLVCSGDNDPQWVWPPNCTIDARRPYPPNEPAQRQGVDFFRWNFQNSPGAGEDSASDFTIRQVPSATPPIPPTIIGVNTDQLYNAVDVQLSGPIQPNTWTCVKHNASGVESCFGYLPGDVNGNRTTTPTDILSIIDNLNGLAHPALPLYHCDIDRNGACGPADILTEIDLLNGVTGFPAQNGRTLEPCPTH